MGMLKRSRKALMSSSVSFFAWWAVFLPSPALPMPKPLTVMLIKTVKGFGMGKAGEGKNTAHQAKKLTDEDIKAFRDRFNIPIPDSELPNLPFYRPADDTPEMR